MKDLFRLPQRGGEIFITWNGLMLCGISSKTIENWTKIKESHPDDARVKIFNVSNLRPKYQGLIKEQICDGQDPQAWIIDQEKEAEQKKARNSQLKLQESIVVTPDDLAFFIEKGLFSDKEAKELARAWSWLRLLNKIKGKKDAAIYGYSTKGELLQDACVIIGSEDLKGLKPRGNSTLNVRVLQRKMKDASEQGRNCLISGHHGKVKFCKITDDISDWLVAQYAQPVKGFDTRALHYRYTQEANRRKDWPRLSHSAIYQHLMKPEIQPLWFVGRHGSHAARATFGHTLKLKNASARDVMWCSDGTKLDWYYKTDDGRKASLQFYLVVDSYSEVILGWDIDRTENFVTQYKAAKMALQTAGHKPNQWIYDGQGGHIKAESQAFLDKIVLNAHHRVRPYRAHAKPIEQMINRFQQECVMSYWFCDGQGVRTKKLNSRPNMEFILKHQHELPTIDQVIQLFAKEVQRWNSLAHPKIEGKSRMEAYRTSHNPHGEAIHYLEMVDLFWHTTQKPIQYTKDGLKLTTNRNQYWFEVYDADGNIDLDFRNKYVSSIPYKFTVKYDPEDFNEVWLYLEGEDGSLKFISKAFKKREHARAIVDLKAGDKTILNKDLKAGDDEQKKWQQRLEEIRNRVNVQPEDLIRQAETKLKEGMYAGKDDANWAEVVLVDLANQSGEVSTNPWDQI